MNKIIRTEEKTTHIELGERKTAPNTRKYTRSALEAFAIDLNYLATKGRLDDCFGRESELSEVMEVLVRKQKNNPVLVGDAGVGKTAIVEAFASRLADNSVPFVLEGRQIHNLDLARMVAGARYRGEFESRFRRLLDEVVEKPHVILYVDEIHTLGGTGNHEGALDAANILKPVLARTGFQCIGATTTKEYEKIEKDPALNRRFQPVRINQPMGEKASDIIFSLRTSYELFHNVLFSGGALDTAIDLTNRYMLDRFLPDKAIDILDRTAAREVISSTSQENGFLAPMIKTALRKVSQFRLEAFRRGNLPALYVLQEVEYVYSNFLCTWLDYPMEIFGNVQTPELRTKLLYSPLARDLLDRIRTAIVARTEELLYASFKTRYEIQTIKQIQDFSSSHTRAVLKEFFRGLTFVLQKESEYLRKENDEIFNEFFSQTMDFRTPPEYPIPIPSHFRKRWQWIAWEKASNPKMPNDYPRHEFVKKFSSLCRLSLLCFFYTRQFSPYIIFQLFFSKSLRLNASSSYYLTADKFLYSFDKSRHHMACKRFFSLIDFGMQHIIKTFQEMGFLSYIQKLRDFSVETNQPLLKQTDFFEKDIEKIEKAMQTLGELETVKAEIFESFIENLGPLVTKGLLQSLMSSQFSLKYTDRDLQKINILLGYYATETGKSFLGSLAESEFVSNSRRFGDNSLLKKQIHEDEIRQTVSKVTGVPMEAMSNQEQEKLLNLEKTLHERVVGQEDAIIAVSKAIRRARLGIQNPNRPIASFFFCGPTGVGKTEVSKALAQTMFGSDREMVRFDMSEFMEKFTVSRLIGAPPGYIGYDDGGQLSDAVRKKPYSVVLLDEIEKAHPDVLNILLQVLEDGRLTDGQKRLVSFENTIIIMTSNVGAGDIQEFIRNNPDFLEDSEEEPKSQKVSSIPSKYADNLAFLSSPVKESFLDDIQKEIGSAFKESLSQLKGLNLSQKRVLQQNTQKILNGEKKQELQGLEKTKISSNSEKQEHKEPTQEQKENKKALLKTKVLEKLGEFFLPEFLNRIDEVIVFRPLIPSELRKICEYMIKDLKLRLEKKKIFLIVDDAVKRKLTKDGYNPAFGARPLRRLIIKYVEDLVSDYLLHTPNFQITENHIQIYLDNDNQIQIRRQKTPELPENPTIDQFATLLERTPEKYLPEHLPAQYSLEGPEPDWKNIDQSKQYRVLSNDDFKKEDLLEEDSINDEFLEGDLTDDELMKELIENGLLEEDSALENEKDLRDLYYGDEYEDEPDFSSKYPKHLQYEDEYVYDGEGGYEDDIVDPDVSKSLQKEFLKLQQKIIEEQKYLEEQRHKDEQKPLIEKTKDFREYIEKERKLLNEQFNHFQETFVLEKRNHKEDEERKRRKESFLPIEISPIEKKDQAKVRILEDA